MGDHQSGAPACRQTFKVWDRERAFSAAEHVAALGRRGIYWVLTGRQLPAPGGDDAIRDTDRPYSARSKADDSCRSFLILKAP